MHRPAAIGAVLLVSLLAAQVARADIYTWVDGNGVVNVSNLTPPAGADVRRVTVEKPSTAAARSDGAREAELRLLAERVRELEHEADTAQRVPPPTVIAPIYVPVTPVVTPVYVPMPVPVAMPYPADGAPPVPPQLCDPNWLGCMTSPAGFYGPGVIVLSPTHRRSSRLPKPLNGPVLWPTGNLAALGPWAPNPAAHPHPARPGRARP